MNIYQTQLEGQIVELIEPLLTEMGYEIIRLKMSGTAKKRKTLQLMLGRLDGEPIVVKDCETASRHIAVLMDVEDPITDEYNLEVSSPGLNRPLTRQKDFTNHVGQRIKLTSTSPIEGRKHFTGLIEQIKDDGIIMDLEGEETDLQIAFDSILEANLQLLENKPNKKKKRS